MSDLYDHTPPEETSSSGLWLVVATGVGVVLGVLFDLGLWAAWVTQKRRRAASA